MSTCKHFVAVKAAQFYWFFFHVSARPDQEKALHWHSGIITDVLGVNLATALCFSWLQSSVQQVRADRMRCTLVFDFHWRCSYWRRSNLSSNLSLSSVFLYTLILLIEMQKRFYRFFFSSCFKKINFIEIDFKSWKGKSLGYARLLRCTLQCARSTWSSACMLPFPLTSFWSFGLVPGYGSALVWLSYNLHMVFAVSSVSILCCLLILYFAKYFISSTPNSSRFMFQKSGC